MPHRPENPTGVAIGQPILPILRIAARPAAIVFVGLGVFMAGCAILAFGFEHSTVSVRSIDDGSVAKMLWASIIVATCGAATWWWGRPTAGQTLSRRDATVAVSLIWFGSVALGAIPYILEGGLSLVDALFESASGFSTTGATVVMDIEGTLPHALLLWRSLTQWLGGMGIVVLFVAVFPNLGMGGKHMYRSEAPGHEAKGLQPRIAETGSVLWRFYLAFTVAEVAVLTALGMSLFDAVNHAWTTMSTGGFSTHNTSVAAFDSPAIELAIAAFMLIAGVNFGLYFAALSKRGGLDLLKSTELRVYLTLALAFTLTLGAVNVGVHGGLVSESFRRSGFMVVSLLTSTGYGIEDYSLYPSRGLILLIAIMVIGGCSGSTAGGFKISRVIILGEMMWGGMRQYLRPNLVHVVRLDRRVVPADVQKQVATLLFVLGSCLLTGIFLVVTFDGTPIPTAFGAVLTCVSNMGPAPFHEGADTFASYSSSSKLLFCLLMILGRLEFLAILALLVPGVWRQ